MIKRASTTTVLAVLIAGMMAGCGSATANPDAEGGEASTGEGNRVDAAYEALPGSIRDSGTLTAGGSFDYGPYLYLDDAGQQSGFDYDIVNALGERMGVSVKWESMAFASLIPSVQNGRVDLATDGLGIVDERLGTVSMFHIASQEIAWLVKAGNPTDLDANHLCGRTVGNTPQGSQNLAVEVASADCVANGEEPAELVFLDAQAGPVAVQSGQLDAFASATAVGNFLAEHSNNFGVTSKMDGWDVPNGLVLSKDAEATELAEALSIALETMIKDGSLAAIAEKHGLGDGIPSKATWVTTPEELEVLLETMDAAGWDRTDD